MASSPPGSRPARGIRGRPRSWQSGPGCKPSVWMRLTNRSMRCTRRAAGSFIWEIYLRDSQLVFSGSTTTFRTRIEALFDSTQRAATLALCTVQARLFLSRLNWCCFFDLHSPLGDRVRHSEIAVLESGDFLELLPINHLYGMGGLGQYVQASQCLDRAIDVHDGKGDGVGDVDLCERQPLG